MAKAKKLPSGRWRVRVLVSQEVTKSPDGKEVRKQHFKSFTADTKSEAERKASQWKYGAKESDIPNLTVEQAITDYIDSKVAVLSPSTVREYKGILRNQISGTSIARVKLQGLTNVKVQKWISEISAQVKAKTVKNAYGLFGVTMRQQMPDKTFHVTMPYRERPDLQTPTDADIRRAIDLASSSMRLAILLCVGGNGALRRGEICAIKYGDIDRKHSTIHIHADMVHDEHGVWVYKSHPKTSASDRIVSYAPEIINQIPLGPSDAYVVGLYPNSVTTDWMRIRKAAGISCRFHDLRAYSASVMLSMGLPMRYVEQAGGWTPGSDALRKIYSRVLPDKEAEYDRQTTEFFKKFGDEKPDDSAVTG